LYSTLPITVQREGWGDREREREGERERERERGNVFVEERKKKIIWYKEITFQYSGILAPRYRHQWCTAHTRGTQLLL
jgi:hypothetical protein